MYYFNKKLWLVISTLILFFIACRSNKKAAHKDELEQPVIENPKPAMETQTDSLKKSLDEQRRDRQLKKRKGDH